MTFDQINRRVLQSNSITIAGIQQSCRFVLVDHFEALELVLSLSILFLYLFLLKKNHIKSSQLHHIPVSVLYYKCQAGNLKFIKDTSQSQDVKIGLCNTGMNHRKPCHIALGSVTFTTREKRS